MRLSFPFCSLAPVTKPFVQVGYFRECQLKGQEKQVNKRDTSTKRDTVVSMGQEGARGDRKRGGGASGGRNI